MKRKTFIVIDWENALTENHGQTFIAGAVDFLNYLNNQGYQILLISEIMPASIQNVLAAASIDYIQDDHILNTDMVMLEAPKEKPANDDSEQSDEDNLFDLVVDTDNVNARQIFDEKEDVKTTKAKIIQFHREAPIARYSADNPIPLYDFDDYLVLSRDRDFLLKTCTMGFPSYTLQPEASFDKAKTLIELHAFVPKQKPKSHSRFFDNKKADTREENKRARQWVAAEALINWTYTGSVASMHEKALKKEPLKAFSVALRRK